MIVSTEGVREKMPAARPEEFRRRGMELVQLWVTDITQHRTAEGWFYATVLLNVYSRRMVG